MLVTQTILVWLILPLVQRPEEFLLHLVLGNVLKKTRLPVNARSRPHQSKAPHHLLFYWNVGSACLLLSQRLPQGHSPEIVIGFETIWTVYMTGPNHGDFKI